MKTLETIGHKIETDPLNTDTESGQTAKWSHALLLNLNDDSPVNDNIMRGIIPSV